MEKYEKYKSLGFEWIGDIPKHWEVKKLKYLTRILSGFSPEQCQPSESAGTIPYIKVDNLNVVHAGVDKTKEFTTENFIVSIKPSILFPKRGAAIALNKVALVNEPFSMDTNIMGLELESDEIEIKYIYYLLKSISLISIADTSTIPQINNKHIEPIVIPFLGLAAQTAIAAYLDEKTARIDKLIANKQRLIELLKEKRTAIINHAVTRGTNPKAKLKLSGIEWLGDIPAHWEVKKLKYLIKEGRSSIKTGPFGSQIKNSDFVVEGPFKVYNQRNVLDKDFDKGEDFIEDNKFDDLKDFEVFERDVLFTTRGTIGKCAIFPSGKQRGVLHPCLIRVQFDESKVDKEWIRLFVNQSSLFLENVMLLSNSTTIEVIYSYNLKEVYIPLPETIKEQNDILTHIEGETRRVDATISKIEKEIDLLQEYRTALISEVVKGKIKVM